MSRRAWVIVTILVLVIVGLWVWLSPARPTALAEQALISDAQVVVSDDGWLLFEPTRGTPDTGLVFYPGGLVPAAAYAPLARAVAEEGHLVAVPHMPLNLAVLSSSAAGEVLAGHPEIEAWAVGGHSLGGAMAASYVAGAPDVAGLVMVAAYPTGSVDLSLSEVDVLVVYGTNDGVASTEEVTAAVDQYPSDVQFVVIEGGNHAQFGSYGTQRGDNPASIPTTGQLDQTAAALVSFLDDLHDD